MGRRTKQKPRPRPQRRRTGWVLAALVAIALIGWGALSRQGGGGGGNAAIGQAALDHVRELVSYGPRPSGSAAHSKMQQYIVGKAQAAGWTAEQDRFTADTPIGPVPMNNIVAKRPGRSPRVLLLATHYDTKLFQEFRFVGANDGGSGTGLLLALAPILAQRNFNHTVWLVWLDGEEAVREWTDADSLYGSRHMAEKLKAEGAVPQIGAFLLVDMIGDRDLDLHRETNSTPWLTDLVWGVARRLGQQRHFQNSSQTISDDHLPFLAAGVPAVDLIDYNYGRDNAYWHTAADTLDRLSAQSLQVVGEVLLEAVAELDRR